MKRPKQDPLANFMGGKFDGLPNKTKIEFRCAYRWPFPGKLPRTLGELRKQLSEEALKTGGLQEIMDLVNSL